MSNVAHADDVTTFEEKVIKAKNPVVVDFWATWCHPCKIVAPELENLATEHLGVIDVVKVDVDANPEVAGRYGVMSIPTIALFENGELVATSIGAKPRAVIEAELGITARLSNV